MFLFFFAPVGLDIMSSTSLWVNDPVPTFFDDDEPSCINSAICPMSVFDKFGWCWDNEEMNDMMLNGLMGTRDSDPGDSLLLSSKHDGSDYSSLCDIIPGLMNDEIQPLTAPLKLESACDSEFDSKIDIKEEPLMADDLEASFESALMSVPPFDEIKIETLDEAIKVVSTNATTAPVAIPSTAALCSIAATVSTSSILSAPVVISTQPSISSTATTYVNSGSLIRIPVRRSANGTVEPNFSKSGTSRPVKAVVVCPSRTTKSILCNVVRSTPKGIVIQKPRSLIHTTITTAGSTSTISSIAKSETTKFPLMALNVISSKEFKSKVAAVAAVAANEEVKIEPTLAALNGADNIKIEYEEVRPETPLSQKSDEEYHPFSTSSSPSSKTTSLKAVDFFSETFMKSPCLLDDDNFNSDSYKCMPPAIVTGQVQPTIPDVFKYTPNSSPTNNSTEMCLTSDSVDSFFGGSNSSLDAGIISQGSTSGTGTVNSNGSMFFNKAAINVDHDYGFTCRTPKVSSIFSADSLGIQTPSASEPPTDSGESFIAFSFRYSPNYSYFLRGIDLGILQMQIRFKKLKNSEQILLVVYAYDLSCVENQGSARSFFESN